MNKENRIHNKTIDELNLPVRTYNALRNEGILTVKDLLNTERYVLKNLPNFGKVSIKKLEDKLLELGIPLFTEKEEICPCCKGSGKITTRVFNYHWRT
jgi:DNA-directed RNA polymerase alpha subunit